VDKIDRVTVLKLFRQYAVVLAVLSLLGQPPALASPACMPDPGAGENAAMAHGAMAHAAMMNAEPSHVDHSAMDHAPTMPGAADPAASERTADGSDCCGSECACSSGSCNSLYSTAGVPPGVIAEASIRHPLAGTAASVVRKPYLPFKPPIFS
jgi:uncharacterized protein involved in copper resistance